MSDKVAKTKQALDGWANALTGIGRLERDKRLSTTFTADSLDSSSAADLWRNDDLAARIVETIPNEMLRQGYEVKVQSDESAYSTGYTADALVPPNEDTKMLAEAVEAKLEELGTSDALWSALSYERAYGGAGILLGITDNVSDLSQPVKLETVQSLDWITVLEPRELSVVSWYNDPQAGKYGKPELFRFTPFSPGASMTNNKATQVSMLIHESRLLLFPGIRVSKQQLASNNGWGDSILSRVVRVLRDFNATWDSTSVLIQDFSQAIFKIKGLAELIAGDHDEVLTKRMKTVDLSRSIARAIMIDSEEDFERKTTSLTDLPAILDKFANRLAAAADMPATLLFGMSPAGLNATGESDIRFFYDRIKSKQDHKLKPMLERLCQIILASKDGPTNGVEPENYSVYFKPLWQPTEKEQAETRYLQSQTDKNYVEMGAITPEEVAASRFSGDQYSYETTIDYEARVKMSQVQNAQPQNQPNQAPTKETPKP